MESCIPLYMGCTYWSKQCLIGLNIESKTLVRDLPLYPVPIIQENMAVYDVLKLFQASEMAIVTPVTRPHVPQLPSIHLNNSGFTGFFGKENTRVSGIKCSRIVGIVTLHDIINSILRLDQKVEIFPPRHTLKVVVSKLTPVDNPNYPTSNQDHSYKSVF